MGEFLTESCIPHEAFLIARYGEVVAKETVVGMIFRAYICTSLTISHSGLSMQDDDTRHSVGAIHQRGRSFQYLYGVNAVAIHLHTMFVAPLLTFLSDTFAHHHYAVVTQSADNRFRDATTRSQLTDAWLMANGINHIGCGCGPEHLRSDNAHGCCGVLQFGVARHSRYCHFVQIQMTEEHIGRVFRMMMMLMLVIMIILSCHCRAYTQQ